MNKILIDTMHIYELLTEEKEGGPYFKLAQAIKNQKITGVISVITLAELVNILSKDIYKEKIKDLLSSNLDVIDTDRTIAIRAGEIHMNYKLPLGDSLIAATGVVENVKHILTEDVDDGHFDAVKNLIKPINLKTALKMVS